MLHYIHPWGEFGGAVRFEFGSAVVRDIYEQGSSSRHARRFGPEVIKGFFKVMDRIDAAAAESDLAAFRGLNYKALQGNRSHQHSLRINDQWRVVVERQQATDGTWLLVVNIEDYH